MVRAILAGNKTMTRRVVRGQPFREHTFWESSSSGNWFGVDEDTKTRGPDIQCPYGQIGTNLWVRETWAAQTAFDDMPPRDIGDQAVIEYQAGGTNCLGPKTGICSRGKWRPSIHMPRWACRLLLEVKSVRVERLQDISLNDIHAEGRPKRENAAHKWYRGLWNSINEKRGYGWDVNPWVFVIEFERTAR